MEIEFKTEGRLTRSEWTKKAWLTRKRTPDLIGKTFGYLTVIGQDERRNGKLRWCCKCICGNLMTVDNSNLKRRSGKKQSCGCERNRTISEKAKQRIGSKHGRWNGGRTQDGNGYSLIYVPGHPNCKKGSRYVYEHVKIMADFLGRSLMKGEIVHHKNGIKDDNHLENLELRTYKTHPPGASINDLISYAENILAIYAPEKLRRLSS